MAKSPLELSNEIINPFNPKKTSTMYGSGEANKVLKDEIDNVRLTQMSPNDYFKLASYHLNVTPEELMEHRSKVSNEMSIDDMRKKMREGTKFDTPWILFSDKGERGWHQPYFQEGLHRMLAAGQEYGMDTKFPVYLGYETDPWNEYDNMPIDDFINFYDTKRKDRQNKYDDKLAKKKAETDKFYKEMTAMHFKVPIEKVTPEMVKQYHKYEDELFKDEWND